MKTIIAYSKTAVRVSCIVAALLLFLSAESPADVEGRPCIPEPTDETITYGDMILCSIDPVGDTDTYRFFGDEMKRFHGHTHSSAAPVALRPVIYPLDGIWKKNNIGSLQGE